MTGRCSTISSAGRDQSPPAWLVLARLAVLLAAVVAAPAVAMQEFSMGSAPCPCDNPALCAPLTQTKDNRSEVLAFVLNCSSATWRTFDWQQLTAVVLFDFHDDQLLCHAHEHGVRVLANANFAKDNVTDVVYRTSWVHQQVLSVRYRFLDGINVDFEDAIGPKEAARGGFVQLMNATRAALRAYSVSSLLVVDVPWSPDCVDGRCYDFPALANVTDFMFVMGYDQRSQVRAEKVCRAGANAPLTQILAGVRNYTAGGVPSRRLLLGLPWYGYDYTCLVEPPVNSSKPGCRIKAVPFQGAPCSDAAGRERPFSQLVQWTSSALQQPPLWSNSTQSPFFNVHFSNWNSTHQVWYDNATSLNYKVMGAATLSLGGLGVWAANFLDAANTTEARLQRSSMWGLLLRWKWQTETDLSAAYV